MKSSDLQNTLDLTAPTIREVLEDRDFFLTHAPGDITYQEDVFGKHAFGVLQAVDDPVRDAKAQLAAGGADRRLGTDHGGHLIGAQLGGFGGGENLEPQFGSLNQGKFKAMENDLRKTLDEGGTVWMDVQTYRDEDSLRPHTWLAGWVKEDAAGEREWGSLSFTNDVNDVAQEWRDGENTLDLHPDTLAVTEEELEAIADRYADI